MMHDELDAAAGTDIPDQRLALMFACAHPAIDEGDPRAADPADRARLRCRDHRVCVSGCARHDGAAALARQKQDPPGRHSVSRARARRTWPSGSMRCWRRSMRRSPKAGPIPAGTETRRRNLAEEGIWLGRLVVSLLPDEPEALGLLALMLFAEARRGARRNADGDYVPLDEQDTAAWDASLIDEAEALLLRREPHGMSSAAISSKPRCSPRMSCAAAPARPIGRRSRNSTARCSRSPARRSWRSIARSRPPKREGPAKALRSSMRSPTMRASPTTSPTGRRVPDFWRGAGMPPRPQARTTAPSASKAIPRSAASCRRAARR